MKKLFSLGIALLLNSTALICGSNAIDKKLYFTENKGQVGDQFHKPRPDVLFSATDGQLTFHLKSNGLSYQQYKVTGWLTEKDLRTGKDIKIANRTEIYRIDINWKNSLTADVHTFDALSDYSNYYLASCPQGVHEVKSYKEVVYRNLYKGIDLKWYQKDGGIKYDYLISEGADVSQIKLEYKGAQQLYINPAGELVIKTPLGTIVEEVPYVTQNNKKINAHWQINGSSVSFIIGSYNKNLPLVIDPGVRMWGTYYGGNADEIGAGCAVNGSNVVYLSGYTNSTNGTSIATTGSHQITYGGGVNNAYLAKFDGSGNRIWATYYGGNVREIGTTCAVDPSGNVFMSGHSMTSAAGVIATPGAHQTVHGGDWDAFLVKFNSAGVRQWGTYYGDPGVDFGYACAVDASGNSYLVGKTNVASGTIVASPGSYQTTYGGFEDAFIVKFNPTGQRVWGTYFGGESADVAFGCTTDASGNIYMSGHTGSTLNIATPGAHQTSQGNAGAGWDAFLVKFNSSGFPIWSTYYGGSADDMGFGCAVDGLNNAYLCGKTNSGNNIATDGAHQTVFGGGATDAYLVKFNSAGVRNWGSYLGGPGDDAANSCAASVVNYVYIVGFTGSSSGIATPGTHQSTYGGSVFDGFICQFDPAGDREWSSYYGSTNTDLCNFCCTDNAYNVYIAGLTDTFTSTDIASPGSHQPNYGGGTSEAFFTKFYDCTAPAFPVNTTPATNLNICTGNSTSLSASGTGTLTWYTSPTGPTSVGGGTSFATPVLGTGNYTYYVEANSCTVSPGRTPITITVNPLPNIFTATSNTLICSGDSAKLSAAGVPNYTWSTGATTPTVMVSPTVTTVYTVTGASAIGCVNTATIVQTVTVCIVEGVNEQSESLSSIEIFPNPTSKNIVVRGLKPGYAIELRTVLGQVLVSEASVLEGDKTIDLSTFTNGVYFVVIRSENNSKAFKVIRN